MSGTTRITVASLAAQVAQHQAQTDSAIMGLASMVERLIGVVGAQHNTPAPVVAQITDAPSVRKSTSKGKKAAAKKVQPQVSVSAPVKREMPAEVREGFAVVKATKDAMSPLNKALMRLNPGAWVKATERSIDQINAALADVAERDGMEVAQAALEAYKVRAQAAAKRSK